MAKYLVGLLAVTSVALIGCGEDSGGTPAPTPGDMAPADNDDGAMMDPGMDTSMTMDPATGTPDTTTDGGTGTDDMTPDDPGTDPGPVEPPAGDGVDCGEPLVEGIDPTVAGACTNAMDVCIVGVESWGDKYAAILDANANALGAPDGAAVASDLKAEGVSDACTACWTEQLDCVSQQVMDNLLECGGPCLTDPTGDACVMCQAPCLPRFADCSGFELPM